MPVSLSFLVEQLGTGVMVVTYLWYEIHYGRLSSLARKLDEVIFAVIALARASPGVDEEAVADRLNGHTPDHLISEMERREGGKGDAAD